MPLFGRPHLVSYPQGVAGALGSGAPAHAAVTIALLHYLTRADGTPPAGRWIAFRELPDGLFYAAAFASRAEAPLAALGLAALQRAAAALGGSPLALGDAGYAFAALPRLPLAVVVWAADEEFAAQASIFFDAAAGHYLATEDLAGLGESLARSLLGASR